MALNKAELLAQEAELLAEAEAMEAADAEANSDRRTNGQIRASIMMLRNRIKATGRKVPAGLDVD